MPTRYLVGYDGSSPSDAALAWAVRRAHDDPAPIVLVHVADGEAGTAGAEVARLELREAAKMLSARADAVRTAESGLAVETLLLEGTVAWELGMIAGAADLIVVGTHKTGRLQGRLLGSRSVQIAIAAPCSVAVVPEIDLRFRTGVVAGVDREQTAAAIAHLASDEAARRHEELLIVEAEAPQGRRDACPALLLAIEAARARHPELTVTSRASARPAAEALLDAARDRALLVLGPGSQDRLRSPLGSVLHDVLMNVNAPVVIARPAEDRRIVPAGPAHDVSGA